MTRTTVPGITGALLPGVGEVPKQTPFEADLSEPDARLPGRFSCAVPARTRTVFLKRIDTEILAPAGSPAVPDWAGNGVPRDRVENETGRVTGQPRLFASVRRRSDWQGMRLDRPGRTASPCPGRYCGSAGSGSAR